MLACNLLLISGEPSGLEYLSLCEAMAACDRLTPFCLQVVYSFQSASAQSQALHVDLLNEGQLIPIGSGGPGQLASPLQLLVAESAGPVHTNRCSAGGAGMVHMVAGQPGKPFLFCCWPLLLAC